MYSEEFFLTLFLNLSMNLIDSDKIRTIYHLFVYLELVIIDRDLRLCDDGLMIRSTH